MQSKDKPYVLLAAELIYLKVCEIKKGNPDFTNINAIETFISSETYKELSSGKFHDELINKLEQNRFIDKKTKKKVRHMPMHTARSQCNDLHSPIQCHLRPAYKRRLLGIP